MLVTQFQSLSDLLEQSAAKFAKKELFGVKRGTQWSWITYGDFKPDVDRFRSALMDLHVESGDRVAIVSDNRVEWAVAAYATYGRGAAIVPMYEAQSPEEWEFILNDSKAKVVIASKRAIYDRLVEMKGRISSLEHVVGMDLPEGDEHSFAALLERGGQEIIEPAMPAGSDLAALVYTSGTTGKPKGVMLTHENICSNINAIHELFPFEPTERSLSFLPWAHAFGQTCELHSLVGLGCSLAINDDVAHLVDNLAVVRPTILFAVPRIFNRIYEGVNKQMADKPAFIRELFHAGVRNATRRNRGETLGPLAQLSIGAADRLIFSKVRERFGGRLKYVISGSAALSKEVAEFIDALGIEVFEGYGLTETSPVATTNYPKNRKIGSVGKPLPGVRVHIDKSVTNDPVQGEIVIYGPNVMKGYFHRPEENAQVLMTDGGFRSGDLGCIDDDGYVYITGRIKEQYKLENGKYVVPAALEEQLKLSPYIANVMLHGANKPFNVALVVVDRDALNTWAKSHHVDLGGDPAKNPKVRELVKKELEQHSGTFKGFERPQKFVLTTEDFTTENGMLTPTLKIKRRNVLAKYESELNALY